MKFQAVLHRVQTKGYLTFELPTDPIIRNHLADLCILCRNKSNDYMTVTIDKPRKPRTTGDKSQNHHLNGHILQICHETGNDYDTVKNAVKMIAVEQMGYPYTELHGVITPKAERDTDTAECAMLIESAHILAAELEIILKETE